MGLIVPLPIYHRNEGNIARSKINLQQSRIQTASLEHLVTDEVQRAHRNCELCQSELCASRGRSPSETSPDSVTSPSEITSAQLRPARSARASGSSPCSQNWNEAEKAERRYVEILVRYLRDALDLNTAVGERIMP